MKFPRSVAAGLFVVAFALLASACGGVKNPEGWASPVGQDSNLYFFPDKDRVTALTLDEGATSASQAWTFPAEGRDDQDDLGFDSVYDATLVDGILYFGSWDGRVLAIDAESGEQIWTLKDELEGGIVGGPIIVDGKVIFGTNDGQLYVRDAATGQAVEPWPADGMGFPEGIWAAPVAADGKVFIATMAGQVTAFDLETAQAAWDGPFEITGAIADMVATDKYLVVPSFNKHLYIVDITNGAEVAQSGRARNWIWTRPVVVEDTVYFGDLGGRIHALDITNRLAEAWAPIDAGAAVKAGPVVIDGTLIVASRGPEVLFIDTDTGETLNKVPIDGGTVRASVFALQDQALAIVATTEGKLFLANPDNRSVVPIAIEGQQ